MVAARKKMRTVAEGVRNRNKNSMKKQILKEIKVIIVGK